MMGIQRLWRGGGTETHVLTLSRELQRLGHQVTIYTSGGEWVAKARNMGLSVQVDPSMLNAKDHTSYLRLRRFLKQHHFDVLHTHDARSFHHISAAARGLAQRPRLIFTVHGPYVGKNVLLQAQREADAILAVSSEISRSLPSFVNRSKVHVVSNGIDARAFHPESGHNLRTRYGISSDKFVVGYCARFTFDKVALGKRVVQAIQSFAAYNPRVEIMVAGRGSTRMISPTSHLHVLGHVEHISQFYRACDAIICTGRTAAEALLCGVPVITIGKAGYHGIVRDTNVRAMIQSNFGDHGPYRAWTSTMLAQHLGLIRNSRNQFRRRSGIIRRSIMSQMSAKQMAYRIQHLY